MHRVKGKAWKITTLLLITVMSVCGILGLTVLGAVLFEQIPTDYETTDIGEYGNYVGVLPEFQEEYLDSFFPETIQADFVDPNYIFRSIRQGTVCVNPK